MCTGPEFVTLLESRVVFQYHPFDFFGFHLGNDTPNIDLPFQLEDGFIFKRFVVFEPDASGLTEEKD